MEFDIRIAVNIIDDGIDINSINDEIYKFLGKDKNHPNIKVDYYICNSLSDNSTNINWNGDNSTIFNSKLPDESNLVNLIKTSLNEKIISKSFIMIKRMYRSYINSNRLSNQLYYNYYSFVISYDSTLNNYSLAENKFKPFEIDYVFQFPSMDREYNQIDYDKYICSATDFLKLVKIWQFIEYLSDTHHQIWDWFNSREDIGGFLLFNWCSTQHIKIRNLYDR